MSNPRYGVNITVEFAIVSDKLGKVVVYSYEAPPNFTMTKPQINAKLDEILQRAKFDLKIDDVRLARPEDFNERGPQWLV